ncbi:unnamed protein product [Pylaiella littoralis]
MKFAGACVATAAVLDSASAFVAPVTSSRFTASSALSRPSRAARGGRAPSVRMSTEDDKVDSMVTALKNCKAYLATMIDEKNCHPLLIRLAWHDAGTFNKDSTVGWPRQGGANASIRFEPEINHKANAGLVSGLGLLEPVKEMFDEVGWSDLIQMASVTAIEVAGGPVIEMRYGRKDAEKAEDCVDEGNLPSGNEPFPDTDNAQDHLRNVFYRMGFGDKEIVALSGAHTVGRAYPSRSGEGEESTKFTTGDHIARADGKPGFGGEGGSSWTDRWLKFDNSYFETVPDETSDPELLKMATDKTLFDDEGFLPFAKKYRDNEADFFEDYKTAHKALSELGVEWTVEGGITI